MMKRRDAEEEITLLMSRLARWAILVLGCVIALQQIDFDLTAFLTGLGILGFTVGFAVQDVSKNFVAGVLLLLQQPFDIGDAIEVGGHAGTVITIDLRATELRTFDGKNVLIPNADVFTSAIVHYGRASRRRIELSAGVAYDSDLEMVKSTAIDAISDVEGVLQDPVPNVVFNQLGPSTVDFTLYYWVDVRIIGIFDAKDVGVRIIKRTFEEAQVEMPYPIQTVHLHRGNNVS
jgi:small conductance mechanosensitive channel